MEKIDDFDSRHASNAKANAVSLLAIFACAKSYNLLNWCLEPPDKYRRASTNLCLQRSTIFYAFLGVCVCPAAITLHSGRSEPCPLPGVICF